MIMAFSGMDKDERQASGTDFWKGVDGKKSCCPLVLLYRLPMLENVSVDVVDCTRVKDVLEVSVRPRSQGRG